MQAKRRKRPIRRCTPTKAHPRTKITVALALMFVLGCSLLLSLPIQEALTRTSQATLIETYDETLDNLAQKSVNAAWKEARTYNEALVGNTISDPFIEGSGIAISNAYNNVLNINNDGIMGYIEIPCIDILLPIYHGTSEEVLAQGAGHLETSSLPVGGTGTHSVICAHRGIPSALLFTRLGELEPGDIFYIHVLSKTLAYKVDDISIVEPDDLSAITFSKTKDYVTLLTCTPYGINTQRLLVRGERTTVNESTDIDTNSEATATYQTQTHAYFTAGIATGALLLGVFIHKTHQAYKRRRYLCRRCIQSCQRKSEGIYKMLG